MNLVTVRCGIASYLQRCQRAVMLVKAIVKLVKASMDLTRGGILQMDIYYLALVQRFKS